MDDGGAYLGFDVISNDREASFFKARWPVSGTGNEDGDAVDKAAAGLEDLLYVPFGGFFAAYGEVADDHVCAGGFEDFGHVHCGAFCFGDDLGKIMAQAVVGHAALYGHVQVGYVCKFDGVVRFGEDGFAEVFAYFFFPDIEGGREFDVADVVAAQVCVHQAGNKGIFACIFVVLDALYEGGVSYAYDSDSDFLFCHCVGAPGVEGVNGFML